MSNALFVAWRSGDQAHGRWGPVGRLEHGPAGYRFVYTRGARTLEGFRPFPGMADLEGVYESEDLFPLFANRLLARSRPEYDAFLVWGGFDPNNPPDPIALLGVTEGRRTTDSLEVFPCPEPDADGCYVSKFFVHGVRWLTPEGLARVSRLTPTETVYLRPERTNAYDPNAVEVFAANATDWVKIGYVPRYLARDVAQLLCACPPEVISARVERINMDAPLQLRVLCRINACWPVDFHPCTGDEFEPIVNQSLAPLYPRQAS